MGLFVSNRSRLRAAAAVAGITALLGAVLRMADGPFGDYLVRSSYDLLHIEESLTNAPVVIVYLDLHSYVEAHQDPSHLWPRELHARLVRRLTAAGARCVIFDIIFGEAGPDPASDDSLVAAIRENGRVVLAAEHNLKSGHRTAEDQFGTRLAIQPPPYKPFADAAAAWGVASLPISEDSMVRQHVADFGLDRPSSLSWAAARWLALPTMRNAPAADAGRIWVRYYGPALTIPHVSFVEALDPLSINDSFFRGKIVFVGARPIEGFLHAGPDEFRNPFHSWSNHELFMPGVEVHATEMLNLLRGDWLHRLQPAQETWLLIL